MKTEKQILIEALKRLEKAGIISDLEEDWDGPNTLIYFAPDRIAYYPTFKFDEAGNIIHAGVTV